MMYELPTSVSVCETDYEIRSDYRPVLDICAALTDPALNGEDKAIVMLDIFYPTFDDMPPEHYQEAVDKCLWFINCGEEQQEKKHLRLMDWEQDFPRIVAPINRVLGQEVRSIPYLHWWSFIGLFHEIGDCLFAQVVRIRDLKARHKKLDKQDREFYNRNREIIDLKTQYSEAENDLLALWTGKTAP